MFHFFLFVGILSGEPKQNQGRGLVDHKLVQPPTQVIPLQAVSRRLFCFGSFVILDVASCYCCYLWLFSLYINIIIGKNRCWFKYFINYWEITVHLAVAGDVYDGVVLCCPFFEVSWMRSGTSLTCVISPIVTKVSVLSNLRISVCQLKTTFIYHLFCRLRQFLPLYRHFSDF